MYSDGGLQPLILAGPFRDLPFVDRPAKLFPVQGERRDTRAGSMSGGQQQMLALSLAILGKPTCLLPDEARASNVWNYF